MGQLIAVIFFVLEVLEALLDLLPYRRLAKEAHARPGGIPIPMYDEPEGVPTDAAPSKTGTHRVYSPEKPARDWQISRRPSRSGGSLNR